MSYLIELIYLRQLPANLYIHDLMKIWMNSYHQRRFTFVRIARVIASPVSMNSASL